MKQLISKIKILINDLKAKWEFASQEERKKIIIILSSCAAALVALIVTIIIIAATVTNSIQAGEQIKSISVSSPPDNTHYNIGEELDTTGLSIQVIQNNGNSYFVDASQCQIVGFDNTTACDVQWVTVIYQGFSAKFNVKIKEIPPSKPYLTGIRLSPEPKTEYKVGEWLDTTGGIIIREYSDGTTKPIDLIYSYISGFEIDPENGIYATSAPGEYVITVNYVEDGLWEPFKTTYTIIVTE